jgi:hypothetical protein
MLAREREREREEKIEKQKKNEYFKETIDRKTKGTFLARSLFPR